MNSDLASEILSLSLEHLTMVAITIAIASALALPAGVILSRRPGPRRWAVTPSSASPVWTRRSANPPLLWG